MSDGKKPAGRKLRPLTAAVALVLVYAAVCLFMYLGSDSLIFSPPETPSYADAGPIIKLKTADGTGISAVHYEAPGSRYTVLYSHGTAEDLGHSMSVIEKFQRMGISAFGYDYHGYGTSGGAPSEDALYQDIDAAYDYLTGELRIPPERIFLYGYSLGSGPSVDLAARRPVGGLILEGAFISALRLHTVYPVLPFDRFENLKKIGGVRAPVLVIHGGGDREVPILHGNMLFDAAREPKTSYFIDGAGHFDLIRAAGLTYNTVVTSFIRNTPTTLGAAQ